MRLSLAMLLMLFGLPFLATAEYIRVCAAEDPVPLKLADGRTILLDGLLAPKADNDDGRSAADQIEAAELAQVIERPIGQDVWLEALTEAPDRWKRIPAGAYIQKSGVWPLQLMPQEASHASEPVYSTARTVSKCYLMLKLGRGRPNVIVGELTPTKYGLPLSLFKRVDLYWSRRSARKRW